MDASGGPIYLTDLADGTLSGPVWQEWLATHPDLAAEVDIARQVAALLGELRAAPMLLPATFEAALMERVHRDATLLGLLDLWLAGFGKALLELLSALIDALPAAEPTSAQ